MTSATSNPREERLHGLIAEYLDREAVGNAPDRVSWLAEHADFAGELSQFLDEHAHLARVGAPLRALAEPVSLPADAATLAGSGAATELSPAVVRYFGDYELLQEIARGGMGVVYRARQKSLNRLVALKMILAGQLAGPTDVQRFQSEATAAGQLDHPNIVPVYEVGEHEGQHYFSMKLIEGDNLARAIAADRWPRATNAGQRTIACLIAATAHAVHYAHQRGILHRDLKPGNILLSARSDRLQAVASSVSTPSPRPAEAGHYEPHVTDFGLAKRVGGDLSLTNTGAIVGTPSYMPPEQASGNKQLTISADVYSLGAILYEMVTGRPPFVGDSALSILSQVSTDEPARPRTLNPSLDSDLETVCLKCLEKEPHRRYPSAEMLADDLERWIDGEPIEARPSTSWERTVKWMKRRPAVAALVGVSIASAAALLIVGLVFNAQLGLAIDKANKQQRDLNQAQIDLNEAKGKVAQQEQEATFTSAQAKKLLAEATSFRLVARSELIRPTNPGLGLLLALEAARIAPRRTTEQNTALATLLQDCREQGPQFRPGWSTPRMVHYLGGGKRVLTLTYDTVGVWDTKSGAKLLEFTGIGTRPDSSGLRIGTATVSPNERVLALTFEGYIFFRSKDCGTILLTDRATRLFDLATGKEVHVLKGHEHRVTSVGYSADGKRLVSGSADGTARIWDLATGKELRVLRGHQSGIRSVAFARDGQVLTFASGSKARTSYDGVLEQAPEAIVDPAIVAPLDRPISSTSIDVGDYGPGEELFACLWNADTGAKITEFRAGAKGIGQVYSARGAVLTPDGTRLVVTHMNAVSFWDGLTGKHLQSVDMKSDTSPRVTLSRDGKRALTMLRNHTLRVWDVMSGKELAVLRGHTDDLTSARFSPDDEGQYVLTTSDDKTARLWSSGTGAELMSLRGHEARVRQADFHPSRPQVVTVSDDHTVRFWNIALKNEYSRNLDPSGHSWWIGDDGETRTNYKVHKRSVWSAAYSPDGSRIATGSFDGTLRLWDTATGKRLAQRRGYDKIKNFELRDQVAREITRIVYSHDGTRLMTVSADAVAKLQDAKGTLKATQRAKVPYMPVRIYDARTGDELAVLEGHTEGVRSAEFSPDDSRVLTVADNRIHSLFVNEAGEYRGSGSAGGNDRTARLFDAKTGKQLHVFHGDWKEIYSASWDHKGERVCIVTDGVEPRAIPRDFAGLRVIHVYDVKSGQEIDTLVEKRNNASCAAFSPDGRRLLTWHDTRIRQSSGSGQTNVARVWDLSSGKILFSLGGSAKTATFAAYSPNGRWIVTTAYVYNSSESSYGLGVHGRLRDLNNVDRTARIWDAETGALVHVLYGHTQSVHNADFSRDSKWLATCSDDRTARVWDVATGKEWITLQGHQDDVKTAQFSADAKTVLTTSWDGAARLWPVDPLPIAEKRRPRELTDEERERFELKKN